VPKSTGAGYPRLAVESSARVVRSPLQWLAAPQDSARCECDGTRGHTPPLHWHMLWDRACAPHRRHL